MNKATRDIWFTADLSLEELVSLFELKKADIDMENYWEWVIGWCKGCELDITRCHLVPPGQTPTRIFQLSGGSIPAKVVDFIADRLLEAGIRPVYLGQWRYLHGNEFDMRIESRID
jgi:hypothetical protein